MSNDCNKCKGTGFIIIEVCSGCGTNIMLRDCGCPCGTGLRDIPCPECNLEDKKEKGEEE